MEPGERRILETLDAAVRAERVRTRIEAVVVRVEETLRQRPGEVLAWEPVPLDVYPPPLPEEIRSSWVFILRADTVTGAEKHSNSHQRMMAYRGRGDFQTRSRGPWRPHPLTDDREADIEDRWISIPPGVWHQAVVDSKNWVVVSFHTVPPGELEEERPGGGDEAAERRRKYVGDSKEFRD
ncbi:MAG: hypothetical protein ACYS47_13305 [Planctomycetota bacterium]|jgi:hypothetical protein